MWEYVKMGEGLHKDEKQNEAMVVITFCDSCIG